MLGKNLEGYVALCSSQSLLRFAGGNYDVRARLT